MSHLHLQLYLLVVLPPLAAKRLRDDTVDRSFLWFPLLEELHSTLLPLRTGYCQTFRSCECLCMSVIYPFLGIRPSEKEKRGSQGDKLTLPAAENVPIAVPIAAHAPNASGSDLALTPAMNPAAHPPAAAFIASSVYTVSITRVLYFGESKTDLSDVGHCRLCE